MGVNYNEGRKYLTFDFGLAGEITLGGWVAEENWKIVKQLMDSYFEQERKLRPNTSLFRQTGDVEAADVEDWEEYNKERNKDAKT